MYKRTLLIGWISLLAAHTLTAQRAFPSLDRTIQGWVDSGYYSGASLIVARIGHGSDGPGSGVAGSGAADRTGAADEDKPIYEKYFGNYQPETVAYIASAGKWLAAATMLRW